MAAGSRRWEFRLKASVRALPDGARGAEADLRVPPSAAPPPADGTVRAWAGIVSALGLGVTFWTAFWPRPYRMAVLACALVPLVAVASVYTSGRQIKLVDNPRRSRAPNVVLAWCGPIAALLLRGLDFKVMDLQNAIVPVAVLTTALTLVVWKIARDPSDRAWKLLVIVPFLAAYSYGVLMEANGLFDSSRSVLYEVKVTGQRVVSGSRGGRTYYLRVSPWGPQAADTEVSVSRRMYVRTRVNDTVHIGVRSGYFHIPWYYVRP